MIIVTTVTTVTGVTTVTTVITVTEKIGYYFYMYIPVGLIPRSLFCSGDITTVFCPKTGLM